MSLLFSKDGSPPAPEVDEDQQDESKGEERDRGAVFFAHVLGLLSAGSRGLPLPLQSQCRSITLRYQAVSHRAGGKNKVCYVLHKTCYFFGIVRVLLTWMGMQDPYSAGVRRLQPVVRDVSNMLERGEVKQARRLCDQTQHADERPGPVLTLLANEHFDALHILHQSGHFSRRAAMESALAKIHPNLQIDFHLVELTDPRAYEELFSGVRAVCCQIREAHGEKDVAYGIHLSPGTPQMHATWILLTQTGLFPATTYQTTEVPARPPAEAVKIPFDIDVEVVQPALDSMQAEIRTLNLERAIEESAFKALVHRSDAMRSVIGKALQLARLNISVLIVGPSGTGKDLLARGVHFSSPRAKRPFVAVNCGAFPETLIEAELFGHERGAFTGAVGRRKGLFEQASTGTLFLDEIGALPLHLQPRLLRAVEQGAVRRIGGDNDVPVDVRIIAATNVDLRQRVAEGSFRQDLFYRLNEVMLILPTLSERTTDIEVLAKHFVHRFNDEFAKTDPDYIPKTLAPGAKRALLTFPWPGNVRQLSNVIRRVLALTEGNRIERRDIVEALGMGPQNSADQLLASLTLPDDGFRIVEFLDQIEQRLIQQAFRESRTIAEASTRLGYNNYQTLSKRLEKYGIAKSKHFNR